MRLLNIVALYSILFFTILGLGSSVIIFLRNQQERTEYVDSMINSIKKEITRVGNSCINPGIKLPDKNKMSWITLQKDLKNSIVQIFAENSTFNWLEPYKSPQENKSFGSGFLVNTSGQIVTNGHVVRDAKSISVQIPYFGKKRFQVQLSGISIDRDLALLHMKEKDLEVIKEKLGKISFLNFGNSDLVSQSEEIMTLGYPLAQESLKSTTGIVSGRQNMDGQYMIQISAPINPGNSGGPSINFAGEVIGVNTANIPSAQNIGYIIPSNEVKLFLDHFSKSKGKEPKFMRKPYLGILFNAASNRLTKFLQNPEPGGLYVAAVQKGSPLEKVKVKSGDMIYEIDGHRLDIFGELNVPWSEDKISVIDYVSRLKIGDQVNLLTYRKGKPRRVSLTFKESERPPIRAKYPKYEKIDYEIIGGMVVMELTLNHLLILMSENPNLLEFSNSQNQLDGVLIITHVMLTSEADKVRTLGRGMIIKELNGTPVKNLGEFRKIVEKATKKNEEFVTVKSKQNIFAALSLKKVFKDEARLSREVGYLTTPFMKKLIQEKEAGNEAQKINAVKAPDKKISDIKTAVVATEAVKKEKQKQEQPTKKKKTS